MKVAIISDIHDNLVNLKKSLDWCRQENIKLMLCLGDLTNEECLEYLAKNFAGKIHLIAGNADNYPEDEPTKYANIMIHDRKGGRLQIAGKRIGICHEPYHIKNLFNQGKFDMIFYGHTHQPWESEEHGVKLINPGTVSGMFQKSTFAVWDTETDELKLIILEFI